jgi:biotin operon repressor
MATAGKPVSGGEIAAASGLDRKVVDKAMADLKKEGAIVSPIRCKWQPA